MRLIIVGDAGVILTSPDGLTWSPQSPGIENSLCSVTWTGKQFVAVGDVGAIATSPDGITWTPQVSGTTKSLSSVIWTGTQLVAAGDGGSILTSSDGVAWLPRSSGTSILLSSVTWTGTQLVAVGGSGVILTSPAAPASLAFSSQSNSLQSDHWELESMTSVAGAVKLHIRVPRTGAVGVRIVGARGEIYWSLRQTLSAGEYWLEKEMASPNGALYGEVVYSGRSVVRKRL
jgi:hypothetical protein